MSITKDFQNFPGAAEELCKENGHCFAIGAVSARLPVTHKLVQASRFRKAPEKSCFLFGFASEDRSYGTVNARGLLGHSKREETRHG
ncbi:hypothetical protein H671_2g4667 [Cricetulus griseus]|nr:hypothetical protein H671_2g4667 [Cricetulus griseus]